jgi:flagellar biosynthesis regulator FlbT
MCYYVLIRNGSVLLKNLVDVCFMFRDVVILGVSPSSRMKHLYLIVLMALILEMVGGDAGERGERTKLLLQVTADFTDECLQTQKRTSKGEDNNTIFINRQLMIQQSQITYLNYEWIRGNL